MKQLRSLKEIETMVAWLEDKIAKWEERESLEGIGTRMNTSQCEHSRIEYASWLAQRDFLLKLRIQVQNNSKAEDQKVSNASTKVDSDDHEFTFIEDPYNNPGKRISLSAEEAIKLVEEKKRQGYSLRKEILIYFEKDL